MATPAGDTGTLTSRGDSEPWLRGQPRGTETSRCLNAKPHPSQGTQGTHPPSCTVTPTGQHETRAGTFCHRHKKKGGMFPVGGHHVRRWPEEGRDEMGRACGLDRAVPEAHPGNFSLFELINPPTPCGFSLSQSRSDFIITVKEP